MIREKCRDIMDDVIDIRRKIHMYPETGMECKKTIDLICQELDRIDVEYRRLGNSGVIADIHGRQKEGSRTVMLRADMDALEVLEETGLDFSSRINGRMHACGHDLHTAMLLGTARILSEMKDEFYGNVRLLFQCGEEQSDGALFLIENGALDQVDLGLGIHMDPMAKCHKVSSRTGPDWAAVDRFVIRVIGKGGHGAMPHQSNDATIAACSIAMNLQTIVSRMCNPMHPLVVTIGQIHSGTAYNIISQEAVLEGTCRCFDEDVYDLIPEAVEKISSNVASAFNCQAKTEIMRLAKPLINDEKVFEMAKLSAEKVLFSKDDFFICEQAMIGEDFSEYACRVPCVFMHLGADGGYPLHNSRIDFKEETMETGMALQVQFVLDALND